MSKKKKLVNHVLMVLDSSGSMSHLRRNVVDTFNARIKDIKDNAKKFGQETYVSLVTFANNVKIEFWDVPAEKVKEITDYNYLPGGSTSLLDAVGISVERLLREKDSRGPSKGHLRLYTPDESFLVMTITDGQENNSVFFKPERLTELILDCQKTDRWTFAFEIPLGGRYYCEKFGIPSDNIREWEATTKGLCETQVATQRGLSSYYSSRNLGRGSTQDFYLQTNMENVSKTEIKDKLTNLASHFKLLSCNTSSPIQIRDFVETYGGTIYKKGNAFYELTKPETVQSYKEVLIMEKGKDLVWGGQESRNLIGLPDNLNAKIIPGEHKNYIIFIQSTSFNRKILPQNKVLIRK